jgi:hypothetical protein
LKDMSRFWNMFAVASAMDDILTLDGDEALSLLQTRAIASSNSSNPELGHDSKFNFDNCASFGNAADILGTKGDWKTTADIGFCKCWGDTHCSHMPWDENPAARKKIAAGLDLHYQYNGLGASRFAKADDGSWEVQVWQCGGRLSSRRGLGLQRGVAVKVGNYLAEAVLTSNGGYKCFVNGEDKTEPGGQEFHLPNGFHFRCPGTPAGVPAHPPAFCATLEGQFATSVNMWEWKSQLNHVLAVPWSVEVQKANTMCYDASSKDNPMIRHGKQMSQTAVVPSDEVIFSAAAFEYIGGPSSQCILSEPRQQPQPVDPEGPVDGKSICDDKDPELWEHAQANCAPLKEKHASFYEDCLVDECLRADDSEEEDIEGIVEAEEVVDEGDDRCTIEPLILKKPSYSNLANLGPDTGNPEGILYPDAGVINGQIVNVRLTAVGDYTPSKSSVNKVKNGLGVVNMKCGTSGSFQIKIESTDGAPISVDALALTVYDLDEGKKTKGRTTVVACGSTMHAGDELSQSSVDNCPSVTSTMHGTAQNNPLEASGVTDEQKSRAVTFAYGAGSSFDLQVSMAKGPKGRNVLFALQPVVGC